MNIMVNMGLWIQSFLNLATFEQLRELLQLFLAILTGLITLLTLIRSRSNSKVLTDQNKELAQIHTKVNGVTGALIESANTAAIAANTAASVAKQEVNNLRTQIENGKK